MLSTTDPLLKATQFTYDALGRQITQTDPLGKTTSTTYDPLGNVLTVTNPRGFTTAFTPNELGQNILVQTDAPGTDYWTLYAYDKNHNASLRESSSRGYRTESRTGPGRSSRPCATRSSTVRR